MLPIRPCWWMWPGVLLGGSEYKVIVHAHYFQSQTSLLCNNTKPTFNCLLCWIEFLRIFPTDVFNYHCIIFCMMLNLIEDYNVIRLIPGRFISKHSRDKSVSESPFKSGTFQSAPWSWNLLWNEQQLIICLTVPGFWRDYTRFEIKKIF